MSEKQSRQLDEFLKFIVKAGPSELEQVHTIVFPEEKYSTCLSLFYIIKDYRPELLYPERLTEDDVFWAREYLKAFLDEGGFSSIYDREYAKIKKKEERELLETEKLKLDVKNSKRIFKTYWWTFAFALAALLISLINLVMKLLE